MTNWKTTLAGAVVALGIFLQTIVDPPWIKQVGELLAGGGAFLTGFFAKDKNVSNAPNPVASAVVPKETV